MAQNRTASVKLIINADDFGCSPIINQEIINLIEVGHITSSTIMANGPCFEEAISFAIRHKKCSFGVHLNLTQFIPLSGSGCHGSILDHNGCLQRKPNHVYWDFKLQLACYKELCRQIDRCIATGLNISHIDSHHHIHTVPALLPIIFKIQRKYKIRRIRLSKNIYHDEVVGKIKLLSKAFYNSSLRLGYSSRITDGFTEFLTFFRKAQIERLPHRCVELMTHPGTRQGQEEIAILKDNWQSQLCFPVSLISYNDL